MWLNKKKIILVVLILSVLFIFPTFNVFGKCIFYDWTQQQCSEEFGFFNISGEGECCIDVDSSTCFSMGGDHRDGLCETPQEGKYKLTITVVNNSDKTQKIQGAWVYIDNDLVGFTNNTGQWSSSLLEGYHTIEIGAEGFNTYSTSIVLTTNTNIQINLTEAGIVGLCNIYGVVKGKNNNEEYPLSDVRVSLPKRNVVVFTNQQGRYTLTVPWNCEDLNNSDVIIFSKENYERNETLITNVAASATSLEINVTLQYKALANISGQVLWKIINVLIPGATVFINNKLVTVTDSNGDFFVRYPLIGEAQIHAEAKYKGSIYYSDKRTISGNNIENLKLYVELPESFCIDYDPPKDFNVKPVPGERKLELTWNYYRICENIDQILLWRKNSSNEWQLIAILPYEHPNFIPTKYYDFDVNWNTEYSYKITFVYKNLTSGQQIPVNSSELHANPGDAACEGIIPYVEYCGRYKLSQNDFDSKELWLQSIYVCNENNEIIISTYCSAKRDYKDMIRPVCAKHGTASTPEAICKDDICGYLSGAFYTTVIPEMCVPQDTITIEVGRETKQVSPEDIFCYYDYSDASTNFCGSCVDVKNCYDYRSDIACNNLTYGDTQTCNVALNVPLNLLENNLYNSSPCEFYPTEFYETFSLGICYKPGYIGTDYCHLCGEGIYKNVNCNATVCNLLGACYPSADNTECLQCSETTTCFDFGLDANTCLGNTQGVQNTSCGFVTAISDDNCMIGGCALSNNQCVQKFYLKHITKPETTGIPFIGRNGYLTFKTEPQLFGGKATAQRLEFYLTKNFDPNKPLSESCNGFASSSSVFNFNGETNITYYDINRSGFYNGAGYYYLIYRSVFKYNENYEIRENASFMKVYIDFDMPHIEINISEPEPNEDAEETSFVKITVGFPNEIEPLSCSFTLMSDTNIIDSKPFSTPQQMYELKYNLKDGTYIIEATCRDVTGNEATQQKEFSISKYNFVIPTSPSGPQALNKLTFQANITLYSDKIECKLTNDSKEWNMSCMLYCGTVPSVYATQEVELESNRLYDNFKAVCTFKDNQGNIINEKEAYYRFSIDQASPSTAVFLENIQEGQQILSEYGQEAWYNLPAALWFVCKDNPDEGFGCMQTTYCIVQGTADISTIPCDVTSNMYIQGQSIEIGETSTICYRSMDKGNNLEVPKCNIIHIGELPSYTILSPNALNKTVAYTISKIFNLTLQFDKPLEECKFYPASQNNIPYDEIPSTMNKINDSTYTTTIDMAKEGTLAVNIECKDKKGFTNDLLPYTITIIYDSSKPRIEEAYFNPNVVINSFGKYTELIVKTDDPTKCFFDPTRTNISEMRLYFEDKFSKEHSFVVNQNTNIIDENGSLRKIKYPDDNGKTFSYKIICQNVVGLTSDIAEASFKIDWSKSFNVRPIIPDNFDEYWYNTKNVTIQVETNYPANCSINDIQMQRSEENRLHTYQETLNEGNYKYTLTCDAGFILVDNISQAAKFSKQLNFYVDVTPPRITGIELNTTCVNKLHPTFNYSDNFQNSIKEFEYWVKSINGTVVVHGTSKSNRPVINTSLNEYTSYYFEVQATDKAGHKSNLFSQYNQSDNPVFTPLPEDAEECQEKDPPICEIIQGNLTEQGKEVIINCTDENNFNIYYGLADFADECNATTEYSPGYDRIILQTSKYLCYKAIDTFGNTAENITFIDVDCFAIAGDADNDGVCDLFDACPDTPIGTAVRSDGCSENALIDSDGDGIPDINDSCPYTPVGEISLIDETGCSPSEKDSDGDGCPDIKEDEYGMNKTDPLDVFADNDGDGFTNGEECKAGTDPNNESSVPKPKEDSDNDGIKDSCELNYFGDLTTIDDPYGDYDLDGLSNNDECFVYGTDPSKKDTDGDGFNDALEIEKGTDPLDPSSKPKSKAKPILLILSLIMIILSVAYLIIKKYKPELFGKKKEVKPEIKPTKVIEAKPKPEKPEEVKEKISIAELRKRRLEARKKRREELFKLFEEKPEEEKQEIKEEEKKKPEIEEKPEEKLKPEEKPKEEIKEKEKIEEEKDRFARLAKIAGKISKEEKFDKLSKLAVEHFKERKHLETLGKIAEEHDKFARLHKLITKVMKKPEEKRHEAFKKLTESRQKEIKDTFAELSKVARKKKTEMEKLTEKREEILKKLKELKK